MVRYLYSAGARHFKDERYIITAKTCFYFSTGTNHLNCQSSHIEPAIVRINRMNCLSGINLVSFIRRNHQNASSPSDAYQRTPRNANDDYKHRQHRQIVHFVGSIGCPSLSLHSFDSLSANSNRKTPIAQISLESQQVAIVRREITPVTATIHLSTFQPAKPAPEPADNSSHEDKRCLLNSLISPGTDKKHKLESYQDHQTSKSTYTGKLPSIPEEPFSFPEQV